jgi:pimeloyl-ACP methyl ester carboxylesterase
MPFSSATGLRIHYWDSEGPDTPILILRGFGDTGAYVSRSWLRRISETFRTLRVDNRGTGWSDVPTGPFSIEELAADAVGVLDAARVERAHIHGHSMGGMIAQALAARFPDRVMGLVLEATAPSASHPLRHSGPPPNPEQRAIFANFFTPDGSGGPAVPATADSIRAFLSSSSQVASDFFDTAAGDEALLEMIELRQRVPGPSRQVLAYQFGAVSQFDAWDRLSQIQAPTLVIHPELDLKPLAHAEAIVAAIPRAELHVIRGSGHTVHWEAPESATTTVAFLSANE